MKRRINEATFMSPVDLNLGRISSKFGEKRSYEIHPGVDIAVPSGTPVKAPADGVVETADPNLNSKCGGTIDIRYGNGYWSRFCHIKKIDVSKGDKVYQGDVVGLSGGALTDTGRGNSRGAHLHFTLKVNGEQVDPLQYIGKSSVVSDISDSKDSNKKDQTNTTSSTTKSEIKPKKTDSFLDQIFSPLKQLNLAHYLKEEYVLLGGQAVSEYEFEIPQNGRVLSPEDGRVEQIGDIFSCKNSILVKHSIDGKTFFTHVCGIKTLKVSVGEKVSKGQVLGFADAGCTLYLLNKSKTKIKFKSIENKKTEDEGGENDPKNKPKVKTKKRDPFTDLLLSPLKALDVGDIYSISSDEKVPEYDWLKKLKKSSISKNESLKEDIKKIKRLIK